MLEVSEAERKRIVNRLKRLEGQMRGLQSMVESGKECEAVLTQIMAAKAALNQVGMHIIGYSMKKCLISEDVTARDDLIDEAIGVFLKYSSCVK
ncbi:MAG: metal-sensitive transcriptional regulator [Coriobacteriia bacterium]|nr:metal-sensitive transcriptional regulator [Coriobacteriia bacterium]